MRVTIEPASCVGQGRCHIYASEVYDLDDDGHGVVRLPVIPAGLHDEARDGAEACPQRAIAIQE